MDDGGGRRPLSQAADLARRAVAVDEANRALGGEVFQACGATFVRNAALAILYDLNHVTRVQIADTAELTTLLTRMEHEFAHCRHRQVVVDPDTPAAVEARLVLDGYDDVDATLVMLLAGPLRAPAPRHPIRAILTPTDWDDYARLKRLDWAERAARLGLGALPDVGEALIQSYRAKVPPLRYWLALVDGVPRGFLSSWEGLDGVGQVEDLFVEAAYRHRCLATALIRHAVDDCRRVGAHAVVIVADTTDTPKTMYATMGFHPVAIIRKYTRHVRG